MLQKYNNNAWMLDVTWSVTNKQHIVFVSASSVYSLQHSMNNYEFQSYPFPHFPNTHHPLLFAPYYYEKFYVVFITRSDWAILQSIDLNPRNLLV